MPTITRDEFVDAVHSARSEHPGRRIAVPVAQTILADQLTPVLAYRRLVSGDQRTDPSFLLESVEGGERQGRHSMLGISPSIEVVAYEQSVTITDRRAGSSRTERHDDPLQVPRRLSHDITLVVPDPGKLPSCLLGGWVGYAAYDSVRYAETTKLPFESAPEDDRNLPDLSFAFYDSLVVFDSVDKLVYAIRLVVLEPDDDASIAYGGALRDLDDILDKVQTHSKPLPVGRVDDLRARGEALPSNMSRESHRQMVGIAKEYIRAGDIFQVVVGQRFEKTCEVDPFDAYRALRAVNPSPYMVYMQGPGCILIASSPEILCRVRTDAEGNAEVTNRPLAGTRKRGATEAEDRALERDLLADPKERAEHVMLVDLGRNDVGKVAVPNSIELPAVMEIERYSHVMHISSTITGTLLPDMDCWDALRAALPVGTISGAPKVRAMQIIDELEPCRRGPYGGGMGYVSLDGQMDIALALRTIVVPTEQRRGNSWTYHIQAAGGIVADSRPDAEYEETVNKAAALARALDVAQDAFASSEATG
ncbi:MAG: anthranilate synthase component I [Planctomycetota bacterium]|jgi:anthranilate synthase component 1